MQSKGSVRLSYKLSTLLLFSFLPGKSDYTLAQSSGGANAYFEQFKSNGSVSGSCDKMLEFANGVQEIILGEWKSTGHQTFTADGTALLRWGETVQMPLPLGGTYPFTKQKSSYGACKDCCLEDSDFERNWNIGSRDVLGGVKGTFHNVLTNIKTKMNPDYDNDDSISVRVVCDFSASSRVTEGDIIINVPVKQKDDQCYVDMPEGQVVDTDGAISTFRFVLISPDIAKRVMNSTEILFRRVK